MASDTVSRVLARYVLGILYDDIPSYVVNMAKNCIMDQLGVQLRGGTLHWTQPAYRMVRGMESRGTSTIVVHGEKTTSAYAAYVNGTFGQSCEMDDVGVGGHAGAATVPPSIAIGELVGASGKDLIRAVVLGYEAMGRVGNGIGGGGERGFHAQSVNGVFGAMTSAGLLLGLDENQMVDAYGIAGSHSCGVTEYAQVGGEVKRLHAGIANRGGVQSALLAKEGLTGPSSIFEGNRGVAQAFGGSNANAQAIVEDLYGEYRMMGNTFKPYPTVITLHSSLDALNKVLSQHQIDPYEVNEINVGMGSNFAHGGTIYRPRDAIGAQFSLAFSFGLRLMTGKNDFDDYENPERWTDPDILRIADTVKPYQLAEATGRLARMAKVEIKLSDGRSFEAVQEFSKGTPQNPQTADEMEAKFRMLASAAISEDRMDKILEAVRNLETLPNVSDLIPLLVA